MRFVGAEGEITSPVSSAGAGDTGVAGAVAGAGVVAFVVAGGTGVAGVVAGAGVVAFVVAGGTGVAGAVAGAGAGAEVFVAGGVTTGGLGVAAGGFETVKGPRGSGVDVGGVGVGLTVVTLVSASTTMASNALISETRAIRDMAIMVQT